MERFHWFVKKAGIQYKQHQYDGVQWCLQNELGKGKAEGTVGKAEGTVGKVRGGIIADEMGLGKTITAIALLLTNFMTKTLIVLPNVLIAQWVFEIQRTTGHTPLVFYGAEKKNDNIGTAFFCTNCHYQLFPHLSVSFEGK